MTRSCWRTTARWPPSTSRCSPATRARRTSASTDATWQRLADTVDLIVDPAALVNHVLPYSQLFGPNVLGTAELIRIALTTKIKPFVYVSTIGRRRGHEPGRQHRGRRRPRGQRDPQGRRQLRQRLRQQQVGRRGAAARGQRAVRPAGLGVPLRHDPGRHHLRRTAQPARHVHPHDAEPGGDRRCAGVVLRAGRRRRSAAGALRRPARRVHRRGDLDARCARARTASRPTT